MSEWNKNNWDKAMIYAIGLSPVFGCTEDESRRLHKSMTTLKNGIEKKVPSLKLEVIEYDIIKNTDECCGPNGQHSYAKFKNKKDTIICIHCLDQQSIATNYDGTFFEPPKNKEGVE